MVAESEMKPATTDGVGRRGNERVSTGTQAAKAAPAPERRPPPSLTQLGRRPMR